MSIDALHVCMYTPSAGGGHALYTQELLMALAEVGPGRGIVAELVTSENLAATHWTSAYPIHPILPRLTHRSEYRTALVWAWSRMTHYTRREQIFLDWLTGRKDLNIIHFQEYTPWLAPRHFRELRRRGLALVSTVHDIIPHCYFEQVRDLARRLPPGRVELIDRFIGEQEVADLFGRSSLVVLPYTSFASQSGVLHQALAHARPVVTSDVGSLGESVRRWGVGEVVPPGDERALARAIEQALDPGRYRVAAKSIACIQSELTWTRTAEATIEVYRSIVR